MILVFHHCGQFIISNMEFLFSWVTNLYICIAQLENIPIKSKVTYKSYIYTQMQSLKYAGSLKNMFIIGVDNSDDPCTQKYPGGQY